MAPDRDTGLIRNHDEAWCHIIGPNHSELPRSHSRPGMLAVAGQEWAASPAHSLLHLWCCQTPTLTRSLGLGEAQALRSVVTGPRAVWTQEVTARRILTVE